MTYFSLHHIIFTTSSFANAPPDTIDRDAPEIAPPVGASPKPHLDYDLQPFTVPALDHYVALHDNNAYFRVH